MVFCASIKVEDLLQTMQPKNELNYCKIVMVYTSHRTLLIEGPKCITEEILEASSFVGWSCHLMEP